MIERVRIADIMTPADEVIFYDPAMEDECVKFCKNRNIEYLPSLEDPNNKAYCRSEKGFFDDSLKIDVNLDAFSEQALSKFKQNKVLFVYNYGEFCGIIHFSDYNNDKIKVYIYSIILLYETSLRKILRINNVKDLRNMDFVSNVLDQAESTLSNISKAGQELRVEIVRLLNTGVLDKEDAKVLRDYFVSMKDYIIKQANYSIGDTRIFGGVKSQTDPFDSNGFYQGETTETKVPVAPGVEINTTFDGSKYLGVDTNDKQMIMIKAIDKAWEN